MGFLSKLWKGVKKTFKKIFKPIKKVFKSIGKFVNKLGIVGQIAMMFIPIPGLGAMFSGLGAAGSKALGWLAGKGAIGSAAASVIGSAAKFVGAVAKPFVNITKGVKGFFENITKYTLNKIPGVNIASAPTSIFGEGGAWSQASEAITTSFKDFKGDIASAASMDISDILPKETPIKVGQGLPKITETPVASETFDPMRDSASALEGAQKPFEVGQGLPDIDQQVASSETFDPMQDSAKVNIPQPKAAPSMAGSVTETLGEETKGFFGDMKDKILAPYQEFAGDPLGTIGDKAKGLVARQLDPMSLLMRPDTPEARKNFEAMYISQQKASDKYSNITASGVEFVQRMGSAGLLQGGFEPMPNPMMGWGGSAYRETMKNLAPGT